MGVSFLFLFYFFFVTKSGGEKEMAADEMKYYSC